MFFVFRKVVMIKGYLSVNDTAEKWGITARHVRGMCLNGQIEGAAKLGREWAIPEEAKRPEDGRIISGR